METGRRCLAELAPLLDHADPRGTIGRRSRVLCAALSQLGIEVHSALDGRDGADRTLDGVHHDVALAAALLSLLTKLDDQVIDSMPFHGGEATDRDTLRTQTRAYLAPTLASIREARAVTDEARCDLAAALGRRLVALSCGPERLEPLLDLIARGWEIQVDAVSVLTTHPSQVSLAQVARTSADISGAWLMMIAMVGTLPATSTRGLTRDEEDAFFAWGLHIQRADALADLYKDLAEGLVSTYPGRLVWDRRPRAYERALAGDVRPVYELYASTGADVACLPPTAELDDLEARLEGLGQLPGLLRWIHGFLSWRYLVHPLCSRNPDDPAFASLIPENASWSDYLQQVAADGRNATAAEGGTRPCSAP